MDLVQFSSTRALRRVEADSASTLALADRFPDKNGGAGWLLEQLRAWTPEQSGGDLSRAGAAQYLAQQYLLRPEALTDEALASLYPPMAPAATTTGSADETRLLSTTPGSAALRSLAALDRALTAADNRPEPQRFELMLGAALSAEGDHLGTLSWFHNWAMVAWGALVDSLMAALLMPGDGVRAARLSRLLLVAGLVRSRVQRAVAFDSAEQIFDLLRHRTPLLPADLFPDILPSRGVTLVRAATVSDLYVVRSEWRAYVAGEIADIRNVMAHEHLSHKTVQIDEHEVIAETEQERISSDERTTEESAKSDIAQEAQRDMALAIHADGQVNVSAQYGTAKIDAHVGVSADYSLHDSSRRATQLSKEVIARSVSKVETRIRSARRDRTLTRYEETYDSGFDNATDKHSRGVYRWVDRIDRYQIFRYPDRLQLEFQLPDPGHFLRDELSAANVATTVKPPPAFEVRASAINRSNYDQLAQDFLAAGVPAPPSEQVAVSVTVTVKPEQATVNGPQWNPPSATSTEQLAVPPGYRAETVSMSGHATPILGQWHRENERTATFGDLEGFHTIGVTVAVGDKRWTNVHIGTQTDGGNSVQGTGTAAATVQYIDADLEFSVASEPMPPLADKVPVTITATGAADATAAVEVGCVPTDEAMRNWQQQVFDALLSSYTTWERSYQAERTRMNLGSASVIERSPARNAELIHEELKRQVIAWLLDESPFGGRPAVLAGGADADLAEARRVADEIQFLEQAFEWTNLSYVPYPYYWTARTSWKDLADLETVDPDLGRFLRAGSARVVLPARPDLTEAVAYWLLFRQPWLGGPPPVPGEQGYLSVATEIRDLTQPPPDGVPGESWDVRVPTTLRWLDPNPDLPTNPLAKLGKPPHEPADPLALHP